MSIPHRNYPPTVTARRPDQNHQPTRQETGGDETPFSVVAPFVSRRRMGSRKDLICICEVEPTPRQGRSPLGWIERDAHELL
jgi:hypothetical protein